MRRTKTKQFLFGTSVARGKAAARDIANIPTNSANFIYAKSSGLNINIFHSR